jgi:uncharacterized OB-fold protein
VTLPTVQRDDYSAPFFDAAKRGELVMPRCENGHFSAPTQGYSGPVARCHYCLSSSFEWQPVSGRASLVSWTVLHFRNQEPATRIAGIVELEEGPWIKALIDVDDDSVLHAGGPLRLNFAETGADGDGERIPAFTPATDR